MIYIFLHDSRKDRNVELLGPLTKSKHSHSDPVFKSESFTHSSSKWLAFIRQTEKQEAFSLHMTLSAVSPFLCQNPDVDLKASSSTLWFLLITTVWVFSIIKKEDIKEYTSHIQYTIHHIAVGGMLHSHGDKPWQQANTTVCCHGNPWTGEREKEEEMSKNQGRKNETLKRERRCWTTEEIRYYDTMEERNSLRFCDYWSMIRW